QRQPRGLADAHCGKPCRIGGSFPRKRLGDRRERVERLRIADVATGVAAMERRLVGMAEVEVGRDRDKTVGGEALGKLADVPRQAIALVNDDDGGRRLACVAGSCRLGEERRHLAACDPAGANPLGDVAWGVAHFAATSARKLGSMKLDSGGGAANSPMVTRASRLALRPSSNNAASGAITCWRT